MSGDRARLLIAQQWQVLLAAGVDLDDDQAEALCDDIADIIDGALNAARNAIAELPLGAHVNVVKL